jgi:hypothetical protein
VSGADTTKLKAQNTTISDTLTAQVKSSAPANSNSKVSCDSVKALPNGDHEVSYTCTGVSDHISAQGTLNKTCQGEVIKPIVGQCSHSDNTAPATTKKVAENTTEGKKMLASLSHNCEFIDSSVIKVTRITNSTNIKTLQWLKNNILKRFRCFIQFFSL